MLRDLDELERAGFDVDKLTPGQRASMDGPVPITESYESWLRKQPRATQKLALGSEQRVRDFRSGTALDEVWAQSLQPRAVVPATIDQVLPPVPLSGAELRAELAKPDAELKRKEKRVLDLEDQLRSITAEFAAAPIEGPGSVSLEDLKRPRGIEFSLKNAKEDLIEFRREKVLRLLEQGKDRKSFPIDTDRSKWTRFEQLDNLELAAADIERIWGREVIEGFNEVVAPPPSRSRAFFNPKNMTVNMGFKSSRRAATHELGHFLEDMDADAHDALVKFLRNRAAGESPRQIPGIPLGEVSFFDKFTNPYIGKRYEVKSTGALFATEILSMGIESLLYDLETLLSDPEYFDFLIDLLRGAI